MWADKFSFFTVPFTSLVYRQWHRPGKYYYRAVPAVLSVFIAVMLFSGMSLADTTRILPLGNSITQGISDTTNYRRPLWHLLDSAGCTVDFIGSLNSPQYSPMEEFQDYDPDHEGRWGWQTKSIFDSLGTWLESYTPHIVLLHIGTNDAFDNAVLTGLYIQAIIELLREDNPTVIVLLAQLIPFASYTGEIGSLNEQIALAQSEMTTQESPVILVDQNTGFDVEAETADLIHPNGAGANKMARRWFEKLVGVLFPDTTSIARMVKPVFPSRLRADTQFDALFATPVCIELNGRIHRQSFPGSIPSSSVPAVRIFRGRKMSNGYLSNRK